MAIIMIAVGPEELTPRAGARAAPIRGRGASKPIVRQEGSRDQRMQRRKGAGAGAFELTAQGPPDTSPCLGVRVCQGDRGEQGLCM